jgi:acetyl-CoA carboxylase biotin carboxyl carrier protein
MELNVDTSLVEHLIRMAEEHDLEELDVHYKNYKIYIKRALDSGETSQRERPRGFVKQDRPPVIEREEAPADMMIVRSPLSGVFYRSPSPSSPAFVEAGDPVTAGQVLCIIEAMKLMNEITSEVNGVVVKILVENGTAIENQQPLMHIRTAK